MTDCPIDIVTCDRCDYRMARETDPFAEQICQLCANYYETGCQKKKKEEKE